MSTTETQYQIFKTISKKFFAVCEKQDVYRRVMWDRRRTAENREIARTNYRKFSNHIVFLAGERDQALRDFKATII